MRRIVGIVLVLLASFSVVMLVSPTAGAVRKNNTYIETNGVNGIAGFYNDDQICRQNIYDMHRDGMTWANGLRSRISSSTAGASYRYDTWISDRAKGNATIPLFVDYGTREVQLRVNSVSFVCAPMVQPYPAGVAAPTAYNIYRYANWVKSTSNATEANPNPLGNQNLLLSKLGSRTYLTRLEVFRGGGSIVIDNDVREMIINRETDSRYWFSNFIKLKYRSDDAITSRRTITVVAYYKHINHYNTGIDTCIKLGTTRETLKQANLRYTQCQELYVALPFVVDVRPGATWDAVPTSSVSRPTAKAGETVHFTHNIRNSSNKDINRLSWRTEQNGAPGEAWKSGGVDIPRLASRNVVTNEAFVIPETAKEGDQFCQRVGHANSEINTATEYSGWACVRVAATPAPPRVETTTDYTGNNPSVPGEEMPWEHTFTDTTYPNRPSTGPVDGTTYFESGKITFHQNINEPEMYVDGKLDPKELPLTSSPDSLNYTTTYYPREEDIGQTICNWFSYEIVGVEHPSGSRTTRTGTSPQDCAEVGKKPKVQVHGNDLRVGGKVQTSLMQPYYRGPMGGETTKFGSWSEYGILAQDKLVQAAASGMASASYLRGGSIAEQVPDQNLWHRLLFANTGAKGEYAPAILRHDNLVNQFDGYAPTASGFAGLSSANGIYEVGNVTLGGDIPAGRAIILKVNGTATINGNINYPANYGNLGELSQVIIVADNVNVTSNVTNIDAWVLSRGDLNTCSDQAPTQDELTINLCTQQLRFNGTVATSTIQLNRTHGSQQGSTEEPAEIFNYRADLPVWARNYAGNTGKVQVIQAKEAAPRF